MNTARQCIRVLGLVGMGVVAAGVQASAAAADRPVQVMLIGTFHMSNPGADLNNIQTDDVLTPKRQSEIARAVDALAKFQPTRVAVEWPAEVVTERYEKFLAGTLPPSRNEVVQLGFRLAHRARLTRVDGIDVDGEFPFEAVAAWAQAHGRQQEIDAALAAGRAVTEKTTRFLATHSIGEVLYSFNEPREIALNHSFYPPLLTLGAGNEQPGAALVSAWYQRNFAICARLIQAARPGDRVVVFYGQGHIYLLRQCLSEQGNVQLVDARNFLKKAK